jgi:dihydrofolate reductase
MRELIVTSFTTLDGVVQAPGGPGEDDDGGFAHGGWSVSYWDDTVDQFMETVMGVPFDLLLGRRTYDIFAAFWPTASQEQGAGPLNAATKYVASRGRPSLTWDRSVLLEGDVPTAVAALKEQDGPQLQVHGSGHLVQTLLRHDLVDRLLVWIFPVVLGSGKRLFAEGTVPASVRLVDSVVSPSGVLIATYEPAGDVVTGSFAGD